MKNFKKLTILSLFILLFLGSFSIVKAGPLRLTNEITSQVKGVAGDSYDTSVANSVSSIVATVIGAALSLLGMIFVILMLYGGFLWMTAGGEEEQVKKALGIIKNAIIGLIVIVAAYGITAFVFDAIGGGSGGVQPSDASAGQ